jgi:2-polyprenyl-6-methoxyphenol hydroxylase-like FAD-dependent oxidoreductase
MRVAIIGAGPAGLLLGSGLVSRRNDVVIIERDGGPPPQGHWARRGVMQFHHAHGFRPQVAEILEETWPAAMAAWLALGAEPITFDISGVGKTPVGHRSRRDTFERALRKAAAAFAACRSNRAMWTAWSWRRGKSPGSWSTAGGWTPIW